MQRRTLRFQFDLDDLLGVVPGATRIGHEDGLKQPEERNRDQISNEEIRFEKCEGERREEHGQEDVEHPSLGVLCANLDHLFAVAYRRLFDAVKLDVCLDELYGAVRARG